MKFRFFFLVSFIWSMIIQNGQKLPLRLLSQNCKWVQNNLYYYNMFRINTISIILVTVNTIVL